MLEKTYSPADVEGRLYDKWEKSGAFAADPASGANPYVIMMPPPNVTGSLHMGHALTFTLQDILVRYNRMSGKDTLWQPGTDHAGIATQMVVERQLGEQNVTRHDLGREKFIEKVWEWKEKSGGTITNQLRRLGASPDWPRERFTMDDGLSAAVRKVFVTLHKQGLIYRDKRLVNWDPKLLTAISDLEVVQKEVKGHYWHFKYPIEGKEGEFITVATTRPETMLGDTGVAVHPDDERYKDLIGQYCILPIVGRRIKIVADEYADPEKGSGAVKITPAHDFNDFEVGKRNDLEKINIMDDHARINDDAPEEYRGLDRFKARELIVAKMEELGLLEKIEDTVHMVPYGDRSNVVIEPYLTDQWFVNAEVLAKPATEAVEDGRIKFVPKNWENTYFEWMRNIQPWCISRQLWWGHRIPAWFGPDGEIFVEETEEEALAAAKAHFGKDVELTQETDVLDTWFSSALWPFSTLGWPDKTPELDKYYPGDVLVTGFDIIFFWVARMIMMGMHFMDGKVPFKDVYIHALVRDEHGQKMSKSKGNVIDPLELIDEYGCDALRLTLTALAAQGRDIKLAASRVEGYRNFATKLWNAARFAEMNECKPVDGFNPANVSSTLARWIVGKTAEAAKTVSSGIESYRFNDAANGAYQFVWGTFCDWYLELAKPVLMGQDEDAKAEIRAVTAWVLDQILLILHPIMPYITEELWEKSADNRATLLMSQAYPKFDDALIDRAAEDEIDLAIRLIGNIRGVRSEMNVPPAAEVPIYLVDASDAMKAAVSAQEAQVKRLARVAVVEFKGQGDVEAIAKGAIQTVVDGVTVFVSVADFIDVVAEKSRLEKEIDGKTKYIKGQEGKLSNESFVSRAPEHIVATEKAKLEEARDTLAKLQEAHARIAAM
ncbi:MULTISPECIES: valine--tRNA ligase [Thalassospira]|jgi:valyl-tRNA synthetase|uniref:Valine--tRNA ligase n=3 Tax=Thalassospira xiamenensis TaxID=220697 RepID=A0ABR5XX77_9PROT|nr:MULTISPECIES: valine--tRNA ligase [Thalassospira]MBR9778902.1 valine--tRNA ligase [Rhodospirillales bacterium]KZC97092.1 valine--tRNA ligase [Thalassospira xiamenensis]KZD08038.1 valine--tRNA ligase [Thalassospira xiamenensis]MAB31967.1 valine--tRNA ligase [Thalassospira sp.]MBL4843740.1 valine--tRNA ligase [Thalassospira sp.]|tara:strand:- start:2622 stop:5288 length:2667 start_codon:yes stop_codon:yes gene_type:complete